MAKKKNKKTPKKHHFVHTIEEKVEPSSLEKKGKTKVVAKKPKKDLFLNRDLIKFSTISATIITIILVIYLVSMKFDVLSYVFEKIDI